ncbi:MAG TPA: aromatic amino acid lyase, partial [Candidatus Thalassarchaeaceae archaeon]
MTNEMIVIDGESLTIEEIISIKEFSTKVRLSDESMNSINESRKLVEKIVSSGEVVYGINTGF